MTRLPLSAAAWSRLKIDPKEIAFSHLLCKPEGCEACRGLGYRGRIVLAEVLHIDEGVHDLILKRSSAQEIRHYAIAHGMRGLTECGWELCKRGLTALTEVMDYAEMMESEEPLPALEPVTPAEEPAAASAAAPGALKT